MTSINSARLIDGKSEACLIASYENTNCRFDFYHSNRFDDHFAAGKGSRLLCERQNREEDDVRRLREIESERGTKNKTDCAAGKVHEGWLHRRKSRQISEEGAENSLCRSIRAVKGRVREIGKETKLKSALLVNETGGLCDRAVSDEDTVSLPAGVTAESISRVHAE